MPVTNPFSITYGDLEVGGSTAFQLHGPYVIEKSYDSFRLVFDVVIAAESFDELQSLSDQVETGFRKRLSNGDQVEIDLDGNAWTYAVGTTLLKPTASAAKSANPETDKGFSRAYTVSIQGELPADDSQDAGLRDVEVLVERLPSRQRVVTMRGTYTATTAGDALERYQDAFDDEADSYLDAIAGAGGPGSPTWELVSETFSIDRQRDGSEPAPHLCNFTRQYHELLVNQTQGQRDDDEIRDHRVTFTDLSQYPGDSRQGVQRLRRVIGSYDCAVDIEETTNLQTVYRQKVLPHLKQLFRTNFDPSTFAIEEQRVTFDESSKRLSISFQFIYRKAGGDALVEVSQSVAYRETRTIDYTPVHGDDELAAEADVGWATLERVWDRVAIVLGQETPKLRISDRPRAGAAGLFTDTLGGLSGPDNGDRTRILPDGWNVIASTSQVTPQWIGTPDEEQIEVQRLTESVVERFHRRPSGRGGTTTTIPRGPSTG